MPFKNYKQSNICGSASPPDAQRCGTRSKQKQQARRFWHSGSANDHLIGFIFIVKRTEVENSVEGAFVQRKRPRDPRPH